MRVDALRRRLEALQQDLESRRPVPPEAVPEPLEWARTALGIEPDPWQLELLVAPAKRELLLCSRQTGKSEACAMKAAYNVLYKPGAKVVMIAPTLRQSRVLFDRVEHAIFNTPNIPKIETHTRTMIRFRNGAEVRALPGDRPDLVRGLTASDVFVDECAFVRDDVLLVVLPMLATTDGSLMLLSTPSGPQGVFYDSWVDGGDDWKRVRVLATECPRISPEFLKDARARLGELGFRQEYGCEFLQASTAFFSRELIDKAFR